MANPELISFRENTLAVTRNYITQPRISELLSREIWGGCLRQGEGGGGACTV